MEKIVTYTVTKTGSIYVSWRSNSTSVFMARYIYSIQTGFYRVDRTWNATSIHRRDGVLVIWDGKIKLWSSTQIIYEYYVTLEPVNIIGVYLPIPSVLARLLLKKEELNENKGNATMGESYARDHL